MTKEILLTQGKVALVDDEDYERVNKYNWCSAKHNNGSIWYAMCTSKIPGFPRSLGMHRFILNPPSDKQIDHVNNNGLDNHKYNLRIVTIRENMFNQRKKIGMTSKYKGVRLRKKHYINRPWEANIWINNKTNYLGLFSIEEDAARAYDEAAKKYFGEYARLNFPEVISGDC